MSEPLVEVRDLKVQFDVREGVIKAVDGVTFDIKRGQTLGVIGESGCGKSVTARAILNMVPRPGKIVGGEIEGTQDLADMVDVGAEGRVEIVIGLE